jgi:dihydrolipoamide dehydrogenase
MKFDTLVIGAGPGGYVAAIRLAQLGKKVAVVEKNRLGGVCLQRGCIPSKALIQAASLYWRIRSEASEFGIEVGEVQVRLEKMQRWKQGIVDRLTRGIEGLFAGNKIESVSGEARLAGPNRVEVLGADGAAQAIEADSILVATGSRSIELPAFRFDGKRILGSRHALELREAPRRMLVIGGGYIGLELGTVFAKLGSEIVVVEMMDQLLPGQDLDLVKVVQRRLKSWNVQIHLKSQAIEAKPEEESVRVRFKTPEGEREEEVDCLLVTVGRRPNSEGLGLEEVGVAVDKRGYIQVDGQFRTSVPSIYAIGDVIGGAMLAHKASKEGVIAAEIIAGLPRGIDYQAVPAVVFTDPEIATVGLSLAQARDKGIDAVESSFPFAALARALTMGHPEGLVKLVAERGSGVLLGGHVVGPDASDLIAELTLALEMGARAEDVALTIHAHPTLPEAIMEAAEGIYGHPIHLPPARERKARA